MASASTPAQPGEIIAGKYRIERVIGTGGVGMVVAARHLVLGQAVALKFLLPGAAHDKDDVRRFEREAQSAVQLKDEHVCRVYDVGELEDGSPFIVLEHLEGRDLAFMVRNAGPLPIVEAVGYLLQVCEAVAEAHSLGIIHRDLKPSNFFVTHRRDGSPLVKVLDFGIAKYKIELEQQDVRLTQTRALLGSPVYMSPEQVRSARSVDQRSDIWSLGVSLFELLTDTVPFGGETVTGVAAAVSTDPVPPIARYRSDVPAALERVIEKCLAKRPEDRFQNVADLAAALVPFGPAEGTYSLYRISGTLHVAPRGGDIGVHESANAVSARSTEQSTGLHTQVSTSHPVAVPYPPSPWQKRLYIGGAAAAALGIAGALFVVGQKSVTTASPIAPERTPASHLPAPVEAPRTAAIVTAGESESPPAMMVPAPEVRIATSPEPAASVTAAATNKKPQKALTPSTGSARQKSVQSATGASDLIDKKRDKKSSVGGSIDDTVDTRH
jgi:eukaryotic-like serine/threonine-protein kinase